MPSEPIKAVYFDECRATWWVDSNAGRKLAEVLEQQHGYKRWSARDLINNVENAIQSLNAYNYVIVFAQDVIPYELFESDAFPMDNLIMRFLMLGGTVVWVGDIPFWYRTNKNNHKEKEEIWQRGAFIRALGVVPVFAEITLRSAVINVRNCGEVRWISRRPVIYVSDLEAGDLSKCGRGYKLIYTFKNRSREFSVIVPVFLSPLSITLPTSLANFIYGSVVTLKPSWLERIRKYIGWVQRIGIGPVSISIVSRETAESQSAQLTGPAIVYEAASSWIRCFGPGGGYFIRLFDDNMWKLLGEEELKRRACIIDYVVNYVKTD